MYRDQGELVLAFAVISFVSHERTQIGYQEVVGTLLRAGADPDIASKRFGSPRRIAEQEGYIDILLAIDRQRCRNSLVELCIGLCAMDFPVLVVLEIHDAHCALRGLHDSELDNYKGQCLFPGGHLKRSVAWNIAKAVKQYL